MTKLEYREIDIAYSRELQNLWSDNEVIRYTNIQKPLTMEETKKRIDRLKQSDVFVIVKDEELIGVVGCPETEGQFAEFGLFYQIKSCFWGQGYGSSAVEWMLDFMSRKYADFTVIACVLAENRASESILKRTGFTFVSQEECTHKGKIALIRHYQKDIGKAADRL